MLKKERKNYITILSVISAFAVVTLHTNGVFWDVSKERYWFTALLIQNIFYFAVPVFFMITGANLMDYRDKYSTKEFAKRRINKVLIPFCVWTILGFIYCILIKTTSIHSLNYKIIFNSFFSIETFVPYYWFFLPLFCIYLSIPVLSLIEKEKRNKIFSYVVALYIVFNSFIPFIINVFNLDIKFQLSIMVCTSFMVYPFLGYLLDRIEFKPKHRAIIYIISFIGLLIMILGTYFASFKIGKINDFYMSYWGFPCVFYSAGIFIFIKYICRNIKNIKIFEFISKYTFAIYLLQFFIIKFIEVYFSFDFRSIFYRLGAPFVIVAICIGIAFLIRKIPLIKKIVP